MRYLIRTLLACCLLLLPLPALARLDVRFVNLTDLEIQGVHIRGNGGGMGSSVRVVPGNFCVFTDGNGSELHEVIIDAGVMAFSFTDMAAVAGIDDLAFELVLDKDAQPVLRQEGAGSSQGGRSIDLEAGPIWDNAHAGERCPQVLEAWLAAHPGAKAEWNGGWSTIRQSEMSVCAIDVLPEEGGGSSAREVAGVATVLVDPSRTVKTDFAAIVNAESMGAIRGMGAQVSAIWDTRLTLPATYMGMPWAVHVEPAESFSRNPATEPGDCVLYGYADRDEIVSLLGEMADAGYRPWFVQIYEGEDMDTKEFARIWKEKLNREDAWTSLVNACKTIKESDTPIAIEVVLLDAESYIEAARGKDVEAPGLRLRVSNASTVTMMYLRDISTLLSMTR